MAIEQVNQFKQAWMSHAFTYTKEYRQICAGQLVALLQELPPPLGVGGEGSYYDCQILAKKVSGTGVDVLELSEYWRRLPCLLGEGPWEIFSTYGWVINNRTHSSSW